LLVLKRRVGEEVILYTSDGPILVEVIEQHNWGMKLGFTALPKVRILRDEHVTKEELAEIRQELGK